METTTGAGAKWEALVTRKNTFLNVEFLDVEPCSPTRQRSTSLPCTGSQNQPSECQQFVMHNALFNERKGDHVVRNAPEDQGEHGDLMKAAPSIVANVRGEEKEQEQKRDMIVPEKAQVPKRNTPPPLTLYQSNLPVRRDDGRAADRAMRVQLQLQQQQQQPQPVQQQPLQPVQNVQAQQHQQDCAWEQQPQQCVWPPERNRPVQQQQQQPQPLQVQRRPPYVLLAQPPMVGARASGQRSVCPEVPEQHCAPMFPLPPTSPKTPSTSRSCCSSRSTWSYSETATPKTPLSRCRSRRQTWNSEASTCDIAGRDDEWDDEWEEREDWLPVSNVCSQEHGVEEQAWSGWWEEDEVEAQPAGDIQQVSTRMRRVRPCKEKRQRLRKLVHQIIEDYHQNPAGFDISATKLPPYVMSNELVRLKFIRKVEMQAAAMADVDHEQLVACLSRLRSF